MAKRFTDTKIWEEDWFIELPKDYKLFFFYIKDTCDHAGVFKVNVKKFCKLNDCRIDAKKALEYFNSDKNRIIEIDKTN